MDNPKFDRLEEVRLTLQLMEAEAENQRLRKLIKKVIEGDWCITDLQEAINDI